MVHKEEQKYALVEPGLKHRSCCSQRKGTSWEELTLISEEIQPVAAIIELCLSEGISKSVRMSVSQLRNRKILFNKNFLVEGFIVTFWAWLCLTNTVDVTK